MQISLAFELELQKMRVLQPCVCHNPIFSAGARTNNSCPVVSSSMVCYMYPLVTKSYLCKECYKLDGVTPPMTGASEIVAAVFAPFSCIILPSKINSVTLLD